MSIRLQLVDHDHLFDSSTSKPVIVNHFDLNSQNHMEILNDMIYMTYSDDSLEILPTCDCGTLKGGNNVGIRCTDCGSLCLSVTERPLESALWIAAPDGVDTLINPEIWLILSKRFMDGGVSVLDWLTNPAYKVNPDNEPLSIKKLKEHNVQRGINYFYQNFDAIINLLINGKIIKNGKVEEREELLQFLKENRSCIFSRHLPIPSKLAFITEKTPMGIYVDPTMAPAIDAIRTISSIENSVTPLTNKTKQSRTVMAISKLASYYDNFTGKSLSPKSGWFRKHVYGSRIHFSFRAVITSLSKPHVYNECHLPWSMSIMFFKVHLISKLLKRGFTPNECIKHLHEHTLKFCPLLNEIFKELIHEGPDNTIPIVLQRNPTLTRGSAQQLNIAKIKEDVNDNTISFSVLILASFNADFDGKCSIAVIKSF